MGIPPLSGTFVTVSTSSEHTCGIETGGTVQCTGWDYYGQSSSPSGTFTQMSAGHYHTCGIDSGGTVQCWGRNDYGQSTPPSGTFMRYRQGRIIRVVSILVAQCSVGVGTNWGEASPPSGTFFTQISARQSLSYMWYRQWWNSAVLGQQLWRNGYATQWYIHPSVGRW